MNIKIRIVASHADIPPVSRLCCKNAKNAPIPLPVDLNLAISQYPEGLLQTTSKPYVTVSQSIVKFPLRSNDLNS